MSEDNNQQNGTANGDVPEIELIIKVRRIYAQVSSFRFTWEKRNEIYKFHEFFLDSECRHNFRLTYGPYGMVDILPRLLH